MGLESCDVEHTEENRITKEQVNQGVESSICPIRNNVTCLLLYLRGVFPVTNLVQELNIGY